MFYGIMEVIHIFSVVAWMSGLLYLPRIFVYHAKAVEDGADGARGYFTTMQKRLYYFIMYPSMVGTWIFGMALMVGGGFGASGWMHAKLLLVVIMSSGHFYFGYCHGQFANKGHHKSPRFYKLINEIPAVLLIAILVLVVLKPF